jgi:hypothetical protein
VTALKNSDAFVAGATHLRAQPVDLGGGGFGPRRAVRRAMRAALVAFVLAVGVGIAPAVAQPALTPPAEVPPTSARGSVKSENTALALSLGGTLGTIALWGIGGASENGAMLTAGSLGIWVAPSFGHWYAGEGWTTGLSWRVGGAGAAVFGLMWTAVDCMNSDCNDTLHPGMALAIGGGVAFLGGIVHDVATAKRAAREHNARLAGRLQDVTVRPTLGKGATGFTLSGRF